MQKQFFIFTLARLCITSIGFLEEQTLNCAKLNFGLWGNNKIEGDNLKIILNHNLSRCFLLNIVNSAKLTPYSCLLTFCYILCYNIPRDLENGLTGTLKTLSAMGGEETTMKKTNLVTILTVAVLIFVSGCATTGGGSTYLYRNGQVPAASAPIVEYNRGTVTPIGETPVAIMSAPVGSGSVPVYTYPDPHDQVLLRRQDVYEADAVHRRAMDHERLRLQAERQRADEARRQDEQPRRNLQTVSQEVERLQRVRERAVESGTNLIPTRQQLETRRPVQSPRASRPQARPVVERKLSAPVAPSRRAVTPSPSTRAKTEPARGR